MLYHPRFSGCLNLQSKKRIMKKILGAIILLPFLLVSCLKDSTINADGGLSSGRFIEIPYSGLENFGNNAVLTAGVADPIVIPIIINVANADSKALDKDLTVTLSIDEAARTAYNGNAANVVKFAAIPDSSYSFPQKTGVIKAGHSLDTLYITFYPNKIDPSKNYMAAITLKDAQGQKISANFSTLYFHTIGNPLAGNYTWDFLRWNNNTGMGNMAGSAFKGGATTFLPDDPTTVEVQTGYYTKPHYVITFSNNAGVLSDFSVQFNVNELANLYTANGVSIIDGPHILVADPIAGHYKIQFLAYSTGALAYRYIIDDFYK